MVSGQRLPEGGRARGVFQRRGWATLLANVLRAVLGVAIGFALTVASWSNLADVLTVGLGWPRRMSVEVAAGLVESFAPEDGLVMATVQTQAMGVFDCARPVVWRFPLLKGVDCNFQLFFLCFS